MKPAHPSPGKPALAPPAVLYLVRHGSTAWNETGRYQGRADPPLSRKGREEALRAAADLAGVPLAAVYASSLQRAVETARCIAVSRPGPSLPVHVRPELREIGLGAWEGLTYAEVEQGWGALVRRWYDDPDSVTPPGAEPFQVFRARVLACLSGIAGRYPGAAAAVVTHGGVVRLALAEAGGKPFREALPDPLPPGGIRKIEWRML